VRKQPIVLKDDPDSALRCGNKDVRCWLIEGCVVEPYPSIVERLESGEGSEHRGLAGPIRTEDPNDLARFGLDGDVDGECRVANHNMCVERRHLSSGQRVGDGAKA
jgi:hypothetical protein